jgi:hypothetical protein
MKHQHAFFLSVIVLMAFLIFAACSSDIRMFPTQPETPNIPSVAKGNGAPSGAHYNLNIIGVPRDKTADMDNNDGHRIFVKLDGKTKILLMEGEDFQVLDANGTDGDGAKFQLPDPDPEDDLVLWYSVWARALGKPGGKSWTRTCYVDTFGVEYCSLDTLKLERTKGPSKFTDVSKELLTLCFEYDEFGKCIDRGGIFDDEAWQYFWDYDNQGLKLAQLRFYPIETDLSGQ